MMNLKDYVEQTLAAVKAATSEQEIEVDFNIDLEITDEKVSVERGSISFVTNKKSRFDG